MGRVVVSGVGNGVVGKLVILEPPHPTTEMLKRTTIRSVFMGSPAGRAVGQHCLISVL
jgi:hypothetical protein